ncbi:hypothetical protein J7E25_00480 [Agromyces sp. ISL-38]|uniref:hypothetical protein n=1 Tax=Agromyces sp. ISL-38 TaxID=2819107 RepID=UPI001BE7469E|nr:hypothetical protein [Agromyces sp. ISL-38]MBT2497567.1 hypothetical protein [Agromyces sp. ISL-38]
MTDLGEPLLVVAPVFILRPTPDILDSGYLAWYLMQSSAQWYFSTESMGSNVRMITKSVLETLDVAVPPIQLQRRIAEAARLASHEQSLVVRVAELRHALNDIRLVGLASEASPHSTEQYDRNPR